jgi:hypothetical protein
MTKDDLVSKDTALKMAIETLELLNEHVYRTGNAYDAINACKKALDTEQVREDLPAQEE